MMSDLALYTEYQLSDVVDYVNEKIDASIVGLDKYISTDNMLPGRGGVEVAVKLPSAKKFNSFKESDTLFSNIRTYFRKVWLAEFSGSASPDVLIFRTKNEEVLEPTYLYYLLSSEDFVNYTDLTSKGVKMPRGDKAAIMLYKVKLPPVSEQRKIAQDLRSIDNKIELNRQINQTLEQIAQAIFKSWFVDFEPVKAKIKAKQNGQDPERAAMCAISGKTDEQLDQLSLDQRQQFTATAALFPDELEESEFGEIPKEWDVKTFGDVSQCFDSKRIPLSKKKREEKKPGNIPYYGATSIMDYVNEWIFDDIYLLLGEDGSVIKEDGTPFIQYIWGKAWVNNHAHVLQGKNGVSTEQLMLFIQNKNIAAYITGAVQLKINQGNMNSIPFLDAGTDINAAFYDFIKASYVKVRGTVEENQTLNKLQDILLPKLLSGEITISKPQSTEEAIA